MSTPGFVSNLFWWGWAAFTMLALVVAVVGFFRVAPFRHRVSEALKEPNLPSLGIWSLSRGNVTETLQRHSLVIPEALWTYDEVYLQMFAQKAHAHLSDEYIDQTLLRWDLVMAVGLAAFACAFNLGVASFFSGTLWISRPASFAAAMAILYGAADVAEDLKLVSILRRFTPNSEGSIDRAEAAAANMLTRVKLLTIVLSVTAGVTYAILWGVAGRKRPGVSSNDSAPPQPGGVPVA